MLRHVSIYQIEDIEHVDYAYRSFDKSKFNFNDYKKVYEMDVDDTGKIYADILEELYVIFNQPTLMPKDFRGHSMSISDVVYIDNKGFYCDAFAWSNIV